MNWMNFQYFLTICYSNISGFDKKLKPVSFGSTFFPEIWPNLVTLFVADLQLQQVLVGQVLCEEPRLVLQAGLLLDGDGVDLEALQRLQHVARVLQQNSKWVTLRLQKNAPAGNHQLVAEDPVKDGNINNLGM
jgi:hypothetical protein